MGGQEKEVVKLWGRQRCPIGMGGWGLLCGAVGLGSMGLWGWDLPYGSMGLWGSPVGLGSALWIYGAVGQPYGAGICPTGLWDHPTRLWGWDLPYRSMGLGCTL